MERLNILQLASFPGRLGKKLSHKSYSNCLMLCREWCLPHMHMRNALNNPNPISYHNMNLLLSQCCCKAYISKVALPSFPGHPGLISVEAGYSGMSRVSAQSLRCRRGGGKQVCVCVCLITMWTFPVDTTGR